MSFVTTQPEALTYAAGRLESLGSSMAAESAAAAAPTTGMIPAAAEEVSALQAAIFGAYGSLYQSINAQAATIHELFVQTLGTCAGLYAATESVNSATTLSPMSAQISGLLSSAASAVSAASTAPPGSSFANIVNVGTGNWTAAASDLLGMGTGGILPAANEVGDAAGGVAGLDGAVSTGAVGPTASAGAVGVPVMGDLGQAAAVGSLSVPPSWAAGTVPAAALSPGAVAAPGWTAPAPQSTSATAIPAGMPAVATAGKVAGYGAPRYGVKPIVMGRRAGV
jgi:hypothetical protein